jgi:HD-GYP domain-containing protein (c-di-GMP phosphodiesterase class II)
VNYEKTQQQLEILLKVSSMINSTLDASEVQKRTIEALTILLGAEAGSLLLLDDETGELFFEVATGEKGVSLKEIRLSKGEGIAGWVAERGEPLIINDVQSDSRFFKKADHKSGFVTKSILCVPVRSKDRVIGVLQGINKKEGEFSEDDLEIITSLSNQVAIAVENAKLYTELKETFYGTAEALAETIELRDPYTGGHTKRVMNYSLVIGRHLDLSKNELEKLRLSAILHDIGKIGVRDNVLLKQGRLDDDEFEKMSRHPGYGSEVLNKSNIKQLREVIPGVRGHHERYDGKGYPDKISNGDISLAARIISVADTFDAMTTDRPYRKGLGLDKAFDELKRCSGSQFDPQIVDAFFSAWREGELIL